MWLHKFLWFTCFFRFDGSDNILWLDAQFSLHGKKKSLKRITGFQVIFYQKKPYMVDMFVYVNFIYAICLLLFVTYKFWFHLQFCPTNPHKLMVSSADSRVWILDGIDVVLKFKCMKSCSLDVIHLYPGQWFAEQNPSCILCNCYLQAFGTLEVRSPHLSLQMDGTLFLPVGTPMSTFGAMPTMLCPLLTKWRAHCLVSASFLAMHLLQYPGMVCNPEKKSLPLRSSMDRRMSSGRKLESQEMDMALIVA